MDTFDYFGLLDKAGIKNGMTVDVVVDLFNVMKQSMQLKLHFEPNDFISALNEKVGKNGTILIRAFTWDYCHGKGFDIRNSPSQAGALGNVAMKRSDYKRTRHPIYSWMVWGKWKEYLCSLDEKESFGENSVFAWEERNENAIQLNIGHPKTNGLTLFHYMEEKVGVSYRYIKNFTDKYTDYDGNTNTRTYSMYVRNLNYVIETSDRIYDLQLEEKEIKKNREYMGIEINLYKIKDLCKVYEDDFRHNKIPSGVTLALAKKAVEK